MKTLAQWLATEGTSQDLQNILTKIEQANRLMYDSYTMLQKLSTTPQGQQLAQAVKHGWDATREAQNQLYQHNTQTRQTPQQPQQVQNAPART